MVQNYRRIYGFSKDSVDI